MVFGPAYLSHVYYCIMSQVHFGDRPCRFLQQLSSIFFCSFFLFQIFCCYHTPAICYTILYFLSTDEATSVCHVPSKSNEPFQPKRGLEVDLSDAKTELLKSNSLDVSQRAT